MKHIVRVVLHCTRGEEYNVVSAKVKSVVRYNLHIRIMHTLCGDIKTHIICEEIPGSPVIRNVMWV